MNLEPAYQGKGWKPRKGGAALDMNGSLWADARVNSEYMDLKAVVLYIPGPEVDAIRDPRKVQHLRKVSRQKMARELRALAGAFRRQGVEVRLLATSRLPQAMRVIPPNLVFLRDLFFNTPQGAVLARMASAVRAGEEKFAAAELAAAGVPIRLSPGGGEIFEGADALWVDAGTVMVGIGNRSNRAAAKVLAALLKQQGVRVLPVKMPDGVQHLLGLVQIVDRRLAAVRTQKAPALAKKLRNLGFKIIAVEETPEILERQGMNFVTVRPRQILMAAHCPVLRRQLEREGLCILEELEISQLINAAGGLACATGILARRLRRD